MENNESLFAEAKRYIAGGVNSPVRAFKAVGGTPAFISRANGAYIYDITGRGYIDYIQSWGPMIVGHAQRRVINAVKQQADKGLSYGAPSPLETELARHLCELVPSLDLVRMVNSGTEATMSAIRLARGFTGRDRIVKFEGCYHGHSDSLLIKAGSGALTLGVPSSPGVPAGLAESTTTLRYNDIAMVEKAFAHGGEEIACVIVEPVAGNMNCIPPVPGFLETLRAQCSHFGAVLIFDEVMTGFRLGTGGAQGHYRITPDLTTLGKVIGGGMPVGAFGGRREIMEQLAPLGPVYQAGTLSGNPVAMAAGIATLDLLRADGFYRPLFDATTRLTGELGELAAQAGVPFTTNHVGSMFGLFFSEEKQVTCYEQVIACNTDRFNRFFHAMLDSGVYLAPSAFEAGFLSAAHNDAIIDRTLEAARGAFAAAAAT